MIIEGSVGILPASLLMAAGAFQGAEAGSNELRLRQLF